MSSTRLDVRSLMIRVAGLAAAGLAAALLAGCDEGGSGDLGMASSVRASHQLSPQMLALMDKKGVAQNSPILIRTFKKEAEFEIWKMKSDGRYVHLKTFPMCRWSGQLGPKMREGDRQVPEGFYKITPGQMNPQSQYYLSFNVGYPNAYDRAQGASGGSIFVHGACSSAGCFSMTDAQIDQIYAVAREAFNGGQQAIQMQSYPFRMTAEHLAKYRNDPNIAFWQQLKEGSDNFEISKQDVNVGVCGRHYVFNVTTPASRLDPSSPCPALQHDGIQDEVAKRQVEDEAKISKLIGSTPAVRTIYADGGQNPMFFAQRLDNVSRPEALVAPTDWLIEPDGTKRVSPVVRTAARKASRVRATKAQPAERGAADQGDRTSSIKRPEAAGTPKPQAAL